MDSLQKVTGRSAARLSYFWLIMLATLPVATVLVSFETDGKFAVWQLYARQLWLPTLIFEIATIVIASTSGCSFLQQLRAANKNVKLLAAIWFVSLIIASVFAEITNLAILSLVTWTIHSLFALAMMHLLRAWIQDDNWPSRLAIWMPVGSACCGALIILFVALVGMDSQYDWISALPGFPHIRHMGYFLMPALALSVGSVAVRQGKRAQYIHLALFSLNLGFVIWIGSRGPLFGLLVTFALSLILFDKMRRREILSRLFLAFVAGCLLSQLIPTPDNSAFNAILRIEDGKSDDFDRLSSGRTELWSDALAMIPDKPLFGHGGNQFRLLAPAARKNSNHPHNSILQFIFDWGLIGAGAFLGLLAMLCLRIVTIAKEQPELCLPFTLTAISIVIFSVIDGLLYYNLPIVLFLIFALSTLVKGASSVELTATSRHGILFKNSDRSLSRPF